jgi:hypothetical protein
MKLQREGTPAKISGSIGGPQSFNIVGSRIAFNILSSGLYSNKIGACIRELACNAWDAHVMAGKRDVPFEIHLPTSFEPWFSVKDYGIGLNPAAKFVFAIETNAIVGSKMHPLRPGYETEVRIGKYKEGSTLAKGHYIKEVDELIDLYCTYFSSNKNDSNDVIGAMGLGSKSPFSYTEGFTVVSRFNGVTRIASAYITEQGTPDIVVQSEEKTPDAPNGLEVSFPVKESDCWEFENNAKVMLETFTPMPTFNTKITIPAQTYVMKTARWGMRSVAETHQGDGMRAIQGQVQYAIGKIDISKMGPELQALTAMPLDLFFPIGELAVAASRETLQLDPVTVGNITKALHDVYTGLIAEVKKEIDKCAQPWEARLLIFKLIAAPGTGRIVNEALNKGELDGVYKSFSLHGKKPVINELNYFHTMIYRFKQNKRSAKYANKSFVFTRPTPEHRTLAAMELQNGTKKQKDFDREFDVERDIAFVINDLKFGGEKYIHYWLQEATDNVATAGTDGEVTKEKTVVYLFSRCTTKDTPAQVMTEAQAMVTKLGNPPVILMSDLKAKYSAMCDIKAPAKPSVPRERRDIVELNLAAEGRRIRYGSSHGRVAWCNTWKRSESQPTGVKYYVTVEDGVARECGFQGAKALIDFCNSVRDSGMFGLDATSLVYGLKKKSPLRLLTSEWVEITSHVMNMVPKVMTRSKEMEMSLNLKPFSCREWDEELMNIAADRNFPASSPMKKFADSLARARKHAKSNENQGLMEVLNEAKRRFVGTGPEQKPVYKDQNVINFQNAWNETVKLYPMLLMSSRTWNCTNSKKVISDYVKMADAASLAKQAATGAAIGSN